MCLLISFEQEWFNRRKNADNCQPEAPSSMRTRVSQRSATDAALGKRKKRADTLCQRALVRDQLSRRTELRA